MRLLLLLLALSLCYSCQKEDGPAILMIPDQQLIKFTSYHNNGFRLSYDSTTVDGKDVVTATLTPSAASQILSNTSSDRSLITDITVITEEAVAPYMWRHQSIELATITKDTDSKNWPAEWTANSSEDTDTYYVGVKLFDHGRNALGAISFSFDSQTGEFYVKRKQFL